jgi:hypothetical protein
MKVYLGASRIRQARATEKQSDVIIDSEKLLVATTESYRRLSVSDEQTLFLWGDIYAVNQSNGNRLSVDTASGGNTVITEILRHRKIEDVSGQLEGNFVGLLVTNGTDATILCDAFNRTEVFYSRDEKGAVIATDLESIVKMLPSVTYSQSSLVNMLGLYGYFAPKKSTIYNEIARLGVGETLVFHEGRIEIKQKQFSPVKSREYAMQDHDRYAGLLENAVQIRGTATGTNWVFLSSGWDSTSILAVLNKLYGASKIRCVIGEMLYSDRAGVINTFEIERAKKVAEYFKVNLDIVPLDLRTPQAVEYWKTISPTLKKQHIYSFSAYNYYRMSEHILKSGNPGDAVFAGEISDGAHNLGFSQFATILEHPDLGFREYSDKMASYLFGPTFFKRILDGDYRDDAVYKLLRERLSGASFDDTGIDLPESDRRMKFFASFFLRNYRLPFYGLYNTKMITKAGSGLFEKTFSELYLKDAAEQATPETVYSWLLYLYNSFFWQGGTVRCLGSKLSDDGRKLRLPYWDGKIHEFLSEMPENWGRGLELKPTKYPLKWSLENRFDYPMHLQTGPHSYLYDVNPQFSHASEVLYGSYVSNYYKEILKDRPYEALLQKDYFDTNYLARLVGEYQKGVEHTGQERTDLLALATVSLIGWY